LVLIGRASRVAIAGGVLLLAAAWCPAALAERTEPAPKGLDGVGITEKLDAPVPVGLVFADEDGHDARLQDFFRPGRPVILTLNYYRCPMLCTLELNGLVDAFKQLSLAPGRDFEVVTVSIDPLETPALARQKKQSYLDALGRPGAGEGWRFLTGREDAIESLAGAVGFGYRYVEKDHQYAHPAAIFVITPEGRISRVLTGVQFEPKTLRLTLVEASSGRIGSPLDQFVLFCFHYDASAGQYAPVAMRLMQLGGLATVILLGAALSLLWLREKRWRRAT
jgi:protein SCO1/2